MSEANVLLCIYLNIISVTYRHVEIVKILLQKGADISIKDNGGLTVFDLATLVGFPEITRLVTPTGIRLLNID